MRIFSFFSLIFLFSAYSYAGWFGADNYEDCFLEKVKGQHKFMFDTARKACERQFPFEKELYRYKDNIEIGWWSSDEKSIYLQIKNNYGDYSITRYRANFSEKPCSETKSSSDYTLTKMFVFNIGETVTSISVENAAQQKCMDTDTIWGRLKK